MFFKLNLSFIRINFDINKITKEQTNTNFYNFCNDLNENIIIVSLIDS